MIIRVVFIHVSTVCKRLFLECVYKLVNNIGIKISGYSVYNCMPQSMLSDVGGFGGKRRFDILRGNVNMDVVPYTEMQMS